MRLLFLFFGAYSNYKLLNYANLRILPPFYLRGKERTRTEYYTLSAASCQGFCLNQGSALIGVKKTLKQTYYTFRKVFEGVQRELFSKSSLCKKGFGFSEAFYKLIKREYRGLPHYSEEEY